MMDWRAYLGSGLIKEVRPNFRQIERQVLRAEKDLRTFELVIDADPEWASTIAYQAMLRLGRALMYSFGYLPADGQQHKTVVEITGGLLGKEYGLIVKYFDRMRRSRNVFFYDSLDTGGPAQARKSLGTAEKLLEAVKAKIAERNPQFGLG
jgi:HEPN domain